MFLKAPRASTDQRVRSLLQKAARRGYTEIVELAAERLNLLGDKNWLRSRSVVITFEECWPLAAPFGIGPDFKSKREALLRVTACAKQKDAAGLGALAYAYHEGDKSMLDLVPDSYTLRIIASALDRPSGFFDWVITKAKTERAIEAVHTAKRYVSVATWPWDRACIMAGALLATEQEILASPSEKPNEEFPYWVALDKHTPEGKVALSSVAKEINRPHRQVIWASFYMESAKVNSLMPSRWWNVEAEWRLGQAGLSLGEAEELWSFASPLVKRYLEADATQLRDLTRSGEISTLFDGKGSPRSG